MEFKKKIFAFFGVAALAAPMLVSCDFLDTDNYFRAIYKEDSIFHSSRNAYGYLWNTPTDFPDPGNIWGNSWTPGETASDEICVRWQTNEFWGARFTTNNINEQSVPNWSLWQTCYRDIQRCNKMLANVDGVEDMSQADKRSYKAYVHFMRGYCYYLLMMNWGPCLIVGDEVVPTSEPADYYNRERATMDETIDYICNEFAQSLKGINRPQDQTVAYFERPTTGAALAMIARLRLIQASPTFNGGELGRRAFGEWKRASDGADMVNQTYDPKRWAVAAAAAKQVIDMNYYRLYTVERDNSADYSYVDPSVPEDAFPNGWGEIDPYHSFADMFNGEGMPTVNREFIWARQSSGSVTAYTQHSFPVYFGGWGGMSVPQRVVDCFYMKDGKLPTQSTLYNSDLSQTVRSAITIGDCNISAGTPQMYNNREVRFYASIGFPGRVWSMNSCTTSGYFNQTFWMSNDDKTGKSGAGTNVNDYCISGYVPYKYIHPDDAWKETGATRVSKPFPIIRYAEVLLEYLEAVNHVSAPTTVTTWNENGDTIEVNVSRDMEQMRPLFNQIRYRVGLPGVDDNTLANETAFDNLIKNERQVELFNEGYRYFDTRRWGTYVNTDANTSNWRGLDVSKDRNDGFWNIVNINEQNIRDRVAMPRMIFLPLQHDELLKSPAMDQNPGYDR